MPRAIFLAAALLFVASHAAAEVVDATSGGFLVRHEATVNAPPEKVYAALAGQIDKWWNPRHTYSGDSKNLTIDARAGGCFCEKLPDGGSVTHMNVVYVAPNRMLRMTGALGPLQGEGVTGSMTWTLSSAENSATKLQLSYSVGGYMQGGLARIAPPVNAVLGEQFNRLKAFVETGTPSPKQ